MIKTRIQLETMSDIQNFVAMTSKFHHDIFLTDGKTFKVSAKSLLGAICSMEWNEIYVECEHDLGHYLDEFRAVMA